jgi:hypothetical protein
MKVQQAQKQREEVEQAVEVSSAQFCFVLLRSFHVALNPKLILGAPSK